MTAAVFDALAKPGIDLRLFGKLESFVKLRIGVSLARGLLTVTEGTTSFAR